MPEYGNELDPKEEDDKKENKWDVSDEKANLNEKEPEWEPSNEEDSVELESEASESICSQLKVYNSITLQLESSEETIKQKLRTYSNEVVEKFLENIETPLELNEPINNQAQMDLSRFVGESASFIKKGHPNFNEVANNPHKYGYKHIVYYLKCKLDEYYDLPYIGYTGNIKSRFSWHIRDGIKGQISGNMTYIQKAMASAITKELDAINKKVQELNPGIIYDDFNFKDIEHFLKNTPSTTLNKFYDFMKKEVLKKHFNDEIWEYHKEKKIAFVQEKTHTLSHTHTIDGKKLVGTIWPNGLNAKAGGSGGTAKARTDIPILDYAALVSLGYKHEDIIKIFNKTYDQDIPSSTLSIHISRDYGSYEELEKRLLKPVIEKLIKDTEDFQLFAIADVINMDVSTLGELKLPKWYNGNKFFDLKALIKAGDVDWAHINKSSIESAKILRGHSVQQWKEWLNNMSKKINNRYIASQCGFTEHYLNSNKFSKPLSKVLVGKELSLGKLKKELRKKTATEKLQLGEDPKDLMEVIFKIKYKAPSQMQKFYEILFKDDFSSFQEIIKEYSSEPRKILLKYPSKKNKKK